MANSNPTLENLELIQRYFDFELSDEELERVEGKMLQDEQFLEDMQLYKSMDQFVEIQYPALPEEPTVHLEGTKVVDLKPKKKVRSRKWMSLAAALVLLVVSAVVFLLFLPPTASTDLAQTYWTDTNKVVFSGLKSDQPTNSNTVSLLQQASIAYSNQNYQATLAILNPITETDALFSSANLLRGEAFFELEQYQAAVDAFQEVIDAEQSSYRDIAYWLQALAHLKTDNTNAARSNLAFIVEQRYAKATAAEELLEKLK